jgi:hypothetical protein
MKRLFLISVLFLFSAHAAAQHDFSKDTDFIDAPTTEVLNQYSSQFITRLYSGSSVMQSIDFGVFPRLNVGFSLAVHNLIGDEAHMKVLKPSFQFKYRIYDGSLFLPSVAIGYDGRKYGYDRESDEYRYDEKGGYIVLGREIIIPNLQLAVGGNVSDFDESDVFFFTGLSFLIEDKVSLMAEWDRVHRINQSVLNAAARIYVSDDFHLDLGARDLTNGDFERFARLRYTASF